VENPGKLFHATPTQNVERIMREGLVPCVTFMQADLDVELTNLSTKDESDLVVFFRHINGVGDEETGELLDTVTLLEVDVRDIPLVWPGQDGDHHYEVRQLITPDRIRVVSTCTLAQAEAWVKEQETAGSSSM
jgi:hypothetical protein